MSFDLDFVGCVGDMDGLLLCLLFALVVTAFAMWLLDLFVFLPGGGESLFSDLTLGGDGDGEKSDELFFCLFGGDLLFSLVGGDLFGGDLFFLLLDGLLLLHFFDLMGDFVAALLCCAALAGLLLLSAFVFDLADVLLRRLMLLLLLFLIDGLLLLGDRLLGDLFAGDGPGLGVLGICGLYLLDRDVFEGASDFGLVCGTFGIIADVCGGGAPGAAPGAAP